MASNQKRPRLKNQKPNHLWGMTRIQLMVLLIIGCFGCITISALSGVILSDFSLPIVYRAEPTINNVITFSTQTFEVGNVIVGCNSSDVNYWIDKTTPRLNAIDYDLEFLNYYPPTTYDEYIPYAEKAKQRYYAQLSEPTPDCLVKVQEIALEELRLFWKGLEAATNGDEESVNRYFSQLVEISIQVDQAILEFEPTPTPLPSSTPTITPIKKLLNRGDIGKKWINNDYSISLINVYRTNIINSNTPSKGRLGEYIDGYKEFIVIDLLFERLSPGYNEFDITGFFLTSYSDNNYFEYSVTKFQGLGYEPFQINYPEKIVQSIAFEVMSNSHNFVLCYGITPGIYISGEIASWCGAEGYEFKFGD